MKLTSNIQHPTSNTECPVCKPHWMLGVGCWVLDVPHFSNRRSRQGIALVITLILLAVTLVMAVAFLAISRRERGSVTTSTDQTTARLAADSALANAQAQIIANILAGNSPYNSGLLVSTNSPPFGFTNLQDYANLFYSPRPPVFVPSPPGNYSSPTNYDFRFYLDLNRNGQYDPNGYVTNVDGNNNPIFDGSGNPLVFEAGDPEWIGVLERPDAAHGPNNKFLSRYIFYAVPADGALDANAIHNQVFNQGLGALDVNDGFYRNEGAGSWEINLAAFLADLNTNEWSGYAYNEPANNNSSIAFDDARSMLAYRYANNYSSLATVQNLFSTNSGAIAAFTNNIDLYSDLTPPLTIYSSLNASGQNISQPWAGADNTNHFFDLTADLFDPAKIIPTNFIFRLQQAGAGVSTYDRYTFYRLLQQLGTDSAPESGKMNLNYDNLDDFGNVVSGKEASFIAWTPLKFFTNAADRMLRAYTGLWLGGGANSFYNFTNTYAGVTNAFGVGNIPVYVNGRFVYTPTVNRMLQLAANFYDATTTNFYPSIFRPVFTVTNDSFYTNVFISGYVQMTNGGISQATEFNDPNLVTPVEVTTLPVGQNMLTNVYGVPWIIGAKKGFPNFNEFSSENAVQMTRKLQVTRTNTVPWQSFTNQMYIMSVTNYLGVECWNSYSANYSSPVDIMVRDTTTMWLTNDNGLTYPSYTTNFVFQSISSPNYWPGYQFNYANSFLTPLNTGAVLFPSGTAIYVFNQPSPPNLHGFTPGDSSSTNYFDKGILPLPQFGLLTTNRLQVVIVDYSAGPNAGQVIDYVQLNGLDSSRNLNAEFADADDLGNPGYGGGGMWSTNTQDGSPNGVPMGVIEQMNTSSRGGTVPVDDQRDGNIPSSPPPGLNPATFAAEQYYFRLFLSTNSSGIYRDTNSAPPKNYTVTITTNAVQAPYTPTRTRVLRKTWQANDPLVHYLASDLTDTSINDTNSQDVVDWSSWPGIFGLPNYRYMPWGGNPGHPGLDQNPYELSLKDPLVYSSDYWDFPTNKFPTVGWLGRVHRGTPWQTVFLKATNVLQLLNGESIWENWSGNVSPYGDADRAAPNQDRLLFDLFTTAPNDNATRGQLSVNQTHLAAWSAVLSGIVVPTNLNNSFPPAVIQPAGAAYTNSTLGFMLQNTNLTGINDTRNNFTNANGLTVAFTHIGDILAVHALSDQSPFLAGMNGATAVSDEMYEWLPQQMMSLLRVSAAPRYVIYSIGQTLKPAPKAILTGGTFSGMITNYEVVSEVATRAVVQVNTQVVTNSTSGVVSTNYSTQIEQFNILPPH